MCVDSWPTFTTAICHSQKQPLSSSSSSSGLIRDMCTVFTKNPATLRSLLLSEGVINWGKTTEFRGIPRSLCHLVRELASLNGLHVKEYEDYDIFIHHNPEKKDWQKKVLPLPISILEESHAELADAQLPYGGSQESLNYMRACIRHLPNHCVTDEKGQPVSWMLTDELCELRMAYTMPEYRQTGHLRALSQALIHRMSSMGLPIYCCIFQQNQVAIKAATSFGFDAYPIMETLFSMVICKDRV
uniref:glycine N-acyltransferase-like protein 2 n=1 Tax=Scatophagus argus TaxID=75038 RepID=UPI001ED8310B|nr:glycine N-acyltransferase-like protein 2 [Scatophagus argus]